MGCASDNAGVVRHVAEGDSIQEQVDAARPGDLILIEPGEYHEAVVVDVEGLAIRGLDRNSVILDGEHRLDSAITVIADGVTVENLTTRNYTINGILVTGLLGDDPHRQLDGFRVASVTAHNNGLYGVYAFQSGNGEIVDSYASGHPDSGFYVGQCGQPDVESQRSLGVDVDPAEGAHPCNVVVRRVTAEYNAVGYEGANGSQVYVVESTFRNNRMGITPNSQSLERLAPTTEANIVGNLVVDNDAAEAPEQITGGFGVGIAVGSGVGNRILRNRVEGNEFAGIVVGRFDRFVPVGNVVAGNVANGNGIDLGYWVDGGPTELRSNCFADNTFNTSSPVNIEGVARCGLPVEHTVDAPVGEVPVSPPGPDYEAIPAPEPQPTMDGDLEVIPPRPGFVLPDLDKIPVPEPVDDRDG